jgi:transposase
MNSAILPRDTTTLQAMVVAQQAEIEHLKLIIAKLRRMQFGQSSEKIDEMVGQLELALEELETGKAERAGFTEIPVTVRRSPRQTRPQTPAGSFAT